MNKKLIYTLISMSKVPFKVPKWHFEIFYNKYIKDIWVRYKNKNPYAKDIEFESIMDEIIRLIEMVM